MMRIIAGAFKGRRLYTPAGVRIRPTSERVRAAIFNFLQHRVDWPRVRVLDLFAGTGSLGLEALSRGARGVTFVERHPVACAQLRRTLDSWAVWERAEPVCMAVERYLERAQEPFEVIFADPPYHYRDYPDLVRRIQASAVYGPNTWLVLEHGPGLLWEAQPDWIDTRRYGRTMVSYFHSEPPPPWEGSAS
ncbi:MAG: 16S rRNA (guanine(966)-N(2))-methyltransferase RsmD [Bacteroidetes bacterium]|nr:16S rRNA (guanine(966)-N(2))-methyltransferase RsmD [Rhodothermia bacterium]MCS7155003.1 16S rRNA (guanine(966)-N(2))-methyltransferase RsmD [Bacteroidota bacterium]MCX7907287.1 16S rRNA (guanine(966)-N(2))-methyltransferase RsmD [Bacteroidota bacterium]MDW8137987.1 16S rRNA (guanine(966)-N(2))-methyltransferase RsmD [Bacteroidota bacterium]MDW8286161.1 16S rRNA (guanine(966)-N(2))-methyltransferase RsmD [Bacteroidota bacterium]